jgi:hypothetical protein
MGTGVVIERAFRLDVASRGEREAQPREVFRRDRELVFRRRRDALGRGAIARRGVEVVLHRSGRYLRARERGARVRRRRLRRRRGGIRLPRASLERRRRGRRRAFGGRQLARQALDLVSRRLRCAVVDGGGRREGGMWTSERVSSIRC